MVASFLASGVAQAKLIESINGVPTSSQTEMSDPLDHGIAPNSQIDSETQDQLEDNKSGRKSTYIYRDKTEGKLLFSHTPPQIMTKRGYTLIRKYDPSRFKPHYIPTRKPDCLGRNEYGFTVVVPYYKCP